MFLKINNEIKNKLFISIKIISFFIIIYLFYKFINTGDFLSILYEIALTDILPIFLIYLSLPILITFRWYLVINNFSKIKFIDLLRNIISGFSFSLILSSALVIDAAKFIKIKKEIGSKNSFILVGIDKILALFLKVIFIFLFLILYFILFENLNNKIFFLFLIVLSFLFFFFIKIDNLIFYFCSKFLKRKETKNIKLIFAKIKKNIPKLILTNFIILLINTSIYFLIFLSLGGNLLFFELLIFVPIIELLGQFSFIIVGMKELSTVLLLSFFNINTELALAAALIYLFLEYLVVITLYIIFNLNKRNYEKL
tara:strand:- start:398 stop:1333 length:936 start_codon:yes stop_codon:yes gene_type:complete